MPRAGIEAVRSLLQDQSVGYLTPHLRCAATQVQIKLASGLMAVYNAQYRSMRWLITARLSAQN